MKQIIEQAAIAFANKCRTANIKGGLDYPYDELDMRNAFEEGVKWQSRQIAWISVKDELPNDNVNILIMCEHGAIFNGAYCNNVWFCMDGYIYDIFKSSPVYSSMISIPPLWKPIAWMPIPTFDQILETNKDVLKRIKGKR